MIEALIAGERDPRVLAGLARGRLRAKLDELEMACDGRFTAGHAQMCRLHLDAYDHLTAQIATLDQLVARAAEPFGAVIARLVTIPGIGQRVAEVIVAETGGDMARFASSAKLAAWAGLAPGDDETGRRRKKAPARKGNPHLRAAMVEAAWAVSRPPPVPGPVSGGWPAGWEAQRHKGRGSCGAHTAVHRLGGHETQRRLRRSRRGLLRPARPAQSRAPRPHHQEALSRLGYQVTLIPPGDGSPPRTRTRCLTGSTPPNGGAPQPLRRRCRAPAGDPQVSLQAPGSARCAVSCLFRARLIGRLLVDHSPFLALACDNFPYGFFRARDARRAPGGASRPERAAVHRNRA